MDAFHERLARVAPARIDTFGFCLAGGYAVQAHGMLQRPSEDVDLSSISSTTGKRSPGRRAIEGYRVSWYADTEVRSAGTARPAR